MSTLYPNAVEYVTINGNYSWSNANYAYKIVPDGTTNAVNTTSKLYYSVWISNNWNSPISDNSIYVDTTTNVWYDGSTTGSPHTITQTNTGSNDTVSLLQNGTTVFQFLLPDISTYSSGPTVTYGPSHGALPLSTGFTVHNLKFTKVGDREYRISYQQKNAPTNSYRVRVSHSQTSNQYIDYTVTTAASGQTINLKSGSLYGTGPQAAAPTPQNGAYIQMRFLDFDAKLGTAGSTIGQGLIFQSWQYLYNNLSATFTPSSGVPGTVFNFTLTGSDDSYASSNTATLTDPSGNVTTFTKNTEGQFLDSVTNVTSIEGDYTVEHPSGVNRGTSTYDNSGPPIVETTSNGGGKRRRYPIISTNLFDRQRSIYSIGNTHKDETLF